MALGSWGNLWLAFYGSDVIPICIVPSQFFASVVVEARALRYHPVDSEGCRLGAVAGMPTIMIRSSP